jgi:hypothetical protein
MFSLFPALALERPKPVLRYFLAVEAFCDIT